MHGSRGVSPCTQFITPTSTYPATLLHAQPHCTRSTACRTCMSRPLVSHPCPTLHLHAPCMQIDVPAPAAPIREPPPAFLEPEPPRTQPIVDVPRPQAVVEAPPMRPQQRYPNPAPPPPPQQQQQQMHQQQPARPPSAAAPQPLAGPNVMKVVMVGSECAPWSKTGERQGMGSWGLFREALTMSMVLVQGGLQRPAVSCP